MLYENQLGLKCYWLVFVAIIATKQHSAKSAMAKAINGHSAPKWYGHGCSSHSDVAAHD